MDVSAVKVVNERALVKSASSVVCTRLRLGAEAVHIGAAGIGQNGVITEVVDAHFLIVLHLLSSRQIHVSVTCSCTPSGLVQVPGLHGSCMVGGEYMCAQQ